MDRTELQKIEDTCDDALISIDELAPCSPDWLAERLVRSGLGNAPERDFDIEAELSVEIKLMQTMLASLEEHIATINDMLTAPAEGDEGFVEDESQAARAHVIKLKQARDRIVDVVQRHKLNTNNTTLDMIVENVNIVCDSVDSVVDSLNRMYVL